MENLLICEYQRNEAVAGFPGALRGVPAVGGVSETLWARIPQMAHWRQLKDLNPVSLNRMLTFSL
jgi:hypothetical protein